MNTKGLALRLIPIALLTLGMARAQAGVKETGIKTIAPMRSGSPLLADIDLYEEPVGHAMRLLAETYDVSIATGALPDTRVTIRLRNIGAQDAFAAVAAAVGLEVVQDGSVLRLAANPFSCGAAADCTATASKPVVAAGGACCREGCRNAGNNFQSQHQPQMADRV